MSFEENNGIDTADLSKGDGVDVTDEAIQQEIEVVKANLPSMQVVKGCYTEEITNTRPDLK